MKDILCVKESFEKYGNASPSKDESSVSVEIVADHKPPSRTFLGSKLKPPATVATFCQSDSVENSKTDLSSESGLKPHVTYSAADYDICQLSAADDSIRRLSAANVHVSQPLSDQFSVSGLKPPVRLSAADDNVCQTDQGENSFSFSTVIRRLARKILSVGIRVVILSLTYIRAKMPVFRFQPVVMVPFPR